MSRMEKHQGKSKKKKVILWILAIILLFVVGVFIYFAVVYQNIKTTVNDQLHETIDSIDQEVTKKKLNNKESLNVLLLGVDEREGDVGRSDTMIVMTLDQKSSRMQMLSIPRDTRTEIIGYQGNKLDKINHAYAFGRSEMSVASVENLLDIDIDYYVRMNMEGLIELVDAVGGVTVDNSMAFSQGGYDFQEGSVNLDGKKALAFVRMRKKDPQGDAGRNERQRQVITGIIEKGASVDAITKINPILGILGSNVATNMKFDDMKALITDYRNVRGDVKQYQMTGTGTKIGGIYYLLVSDEEKQKAKSMIEEYGG